MKSLSLLAFAAALGVSSASMAQDTDSLWKQVQEAEEKDRPKTAIESLEKIVVAARTANRFPEAVKALAKKITLEGHIEGYRAEEQIVRLQEIVDDWPETARPILETVLAHWYWNYFQQNQWRFLERTRTGESPGDDIQTWDLPRILAEIDGHFGNALKAEEQLKRIPIAEWDDLLAKGNVPDSYRPTLYDFVAFEALRFYRSGEQAGAGVENPFRFPAETPVFDPLDDFLAWEIEAADENSLEAKGLRLYQQLLRFHRNDENPDARIDADLGRLEFGYEKAYGEEKNARYKTALKRFVEEWSDHPVSARARANWASVLREEGELVEARNIAAEGAKAFPDTPGGNRCANLVTQIEQPESEMSVERVWNDPLPEVSVRYRNLTEVWFRAYPFDWNEARSANFWWPDIVRDERVRDLLKRSPARVWRAALPATGDFHQREERIAVPDDLPAGFYLLVSSHQADFLEMDQNRTNVAGFWVSDLALILRSSWRDSLVEGFVLQAKSGEPVAGAEILGWRQENNRQAPIRGTRTDENGLFRIRIDPHQSHLFLAKHKGQAVSTMGQIHSGKASEEGPREQTYFFTDRSLYRPGQTIHYKGLSVFLDQEKSIYRTVGDRKVVVVFNDPNGQEIERQTLRTNEYGSFSGNFTAPRDRLMGPMNIQILEGPQGSGQVTVEEYKRPKFKVEIDPPAEAAKLNEAVSVKGTATAYTGAPIDGAEVSYRVVREVRYPPWWGWCFWWRTPRTESQEIAHGLARTDVDGSFRLNFTAKADPAVLEEDEPTFHFTIHADVTDAAGETRSDERSIRVGYTALKASLSADDWQETGKAVAMTVNTSSLDDEGRAAEGTIQVYSLVQPEIVARASLSEDLHPWWRIPEKPGPDPSNPDSWESGELLAEKTFQTGEDGLAKVDFELGAGIYRALLETQDAFGKKVQARLPVKVFDPGADRFGIKIPFDLAAPKWTLEPGESFSGLWGSGYEAARAFVEIFHRGQAVSQYWTDAGRTQMTIPQAVEEKHRGGFQVSVTMVRENRAYLRQQTVNVPWSNKQLEVKWERHRSKLEPGAEESWSAVISGPDAARAVAEVAATLYDESLDAYLPHQWMRRLSVFYQDQQHFQAQFQNRINPLNHLWGGWNRPHHYEGLHYREFPPEILANLRLARGGGMRFRAGAGFAVAEAPAPMAAMAPAATADMVMSKSEEAAADYFSAPKEGGPTGRGETSAAPQPDLDQVSARTNLNETAFFFPHLISRPDGSVKLDFTMPEALTSWKFFAFAHDRELRSGFLTDSVVTAKDLMVQPNPPRFLREGDTLEFTVKVLNQSDAPQQGKVRLTFSDARTLDPADAELGNLNPELAFDIPAKQSRSYSWRLSVPDGQGFLIYKAVASTGALSDGEEGYLPVLPCRILVTESLALPVRGADEKSFSFDKLLESAGSDTLRHQSLTVQMVSNPAWYAVMALPYLMEFPHECSEQIFNRYYANLLGRHIANSDPKIARIFEQWRGTDALDSPLDKNQDLKQVMLEETPWLRQADNQSQARRNVALFFEENRMRDEIDRAFRKLSEQQLDDGLWPWFPGGRGDHFITLYIATGFGRLRHLGAEGIDVTPALNSLDRLDAWIEEIYRDILKRGNKEENHLTPLICFYLYGRSFFLQDREISQQHREAVSYFLGQAARHWTDLRDRQNQAHLAIALRRFDAHPETPKDIVISLEERAKREEEMGMFWRDTEFNHWWYRAPVETQALMIEAFDEVAGDAEAVEDLKVWLLKQKQTQDWKTTKATADAVYALLLRGANLLASDALVEVALGGTPIVPEKVEAGTGFYEQRFGAGEIVPRMGEVRVKKTDPGVSWGGLHWQYFESMENITPHEGAALHLTKTLWVRENSDQGPVLRPVKPGDKLKVGDQLQVRIELRADRDMEYVHLKDQRGCGTEPLNVLSRYRYQDGLGYYESTRDSASHFFIDYLPKGTYVFEYGLRVFHRGRYQSGMANIQCMYAPEFNSHSQSFELAVE